MDSIQLEKNIGNPEKTEMKIGVLCNLTGEVLD